MTKLRDALIGTRLRQKRIDLGRKQTDLASEVGISASYLNLIEHNRRRIGGALLSRLADALALDPRQLSEGGGARLVASLEALQGPDQVEEFAARFPDWAQYLLDQSARISALEETISGLDDRLSHDPVLTEKMHDVLSTVSAIRATSSILVDTPELEADWRTRFHANIDAEAKRLSETSAAMASHFDQLGRVGQGFATPLEVLNQVFEECGFVLRQLEEANPDALDSVVGDLVDATVARYGAETRHLFEASFGRYGAMARKMPLQPFVEAARGCQFNPEQLAQAYNGDLRAVLLRLGHLPAEPGTPEIGFVECDAAGGLLMRRPAPGFSMPRFGAACPRWPLFSALAQPGRPLRATLSTDENRIYDAYALASLSGEAQFSDHPVVTALMVVIRRDDDYEAPSATAVGASCRVCAASACPARREPSILQISSGSEL